MSESLWSELVRFSDEIAEATKKFVETYDKSYDETKRVGIILKFASELDEITSKYPRICKKGC